MNDPETERLVASLPAIAGAGVGLRDGSVTVDGIPALDIPRRVNQTRDEWLRHEAPSVYPNVPRGQPRPTLLFGILQDSGTAAGERPFDSLLDAELRKRLPGDTTEKRSAVSDAMVEKFWYRSERVRYLLPLHSSLALGFRQSSSRGGRMQYKMFRGSILPFLCSRAGSIDEELIERMLQVFRGDDDFTQLDREVLRIAGEISPETSGPSVRILLESDGTREALAKLEEAGGAFCQASLDRFREDLAEVLTMQLPRRDLIDQITLLLALHLAIWLYRVSVVLSHQLDRIIESHAPEPAGTRPCSAGCTGDLASCDLAGLMSFRVGSGGFRSAKVSDPCAGSYLELTSGFLVPLPVTIATANLAADALAAADGPELRSLDLPAVQRALARGGEQLRDRFDAITRVLAICRGAQQYPAAPPQDKARFARIGTPGLYALREALLEARRSSMRNVGRDVVHQLVKEVAAGKLIQANGTRITFFEIDEAMLFLLVRLVCKNQLVPFTEFLEGLRCYGLAPQNREEQRSLQEALERLGMFERYSDAAESAYVHHTGRSGATEVTR
ncbi:DNA phosphorothioation-dependent restriction protein DptG [Actinomadura sp. 7K507]|uniref:DNA phosphorothioation-dependent restriction protein DptG n=1 Tax=Actinomadura sp. 7K507 TaxID=2530365 RepID=UPI001052D978|nr:DNA phosphorothioation-dependent restriction protein DptG [Actinomadura sp. 7K507]TDC88829.1 DNA phosphorothioation-dependent restriction protein DptG [Actinomadura sp. 7K507]